MCIAYSFIALKLRIRTTAQTTLRITARKQWPCRCQAGFAQTDWESKVKSRRVVEGSVGSGSAVVHFAGVRRVNPHDDARQCVSRHRRGCREFRLRTPASQGLDPAHGVRRCRVTETEPVREESRFFGRGKNRISLAPSSIVCLERPSLFLTAPWRLNGNSHPPCKRPCQTNPMANCNDWPPAMSRDQTNPMANCNDWPTRRPETKRTVMTIGMVTPPHENGRGPGGAELA
jgi:hypothetical protein